MRLRLDLRAGQNLTQALAAVQAHPDVEYAELNYLVSTFMLEPNDVHYPVQWALNNVAQSYPYSYMYNSPPGVFDADVNAPQAWRISTGDPCVVVAVIDTGVDYNHRDLAANMWRNLAEYYGDPNVDSDGNGYVGDAWGYDFVNRRPDPMDDRGHGTHCAGIIAAVGDNGLDIAGVAWQARIMALKFLGADGYGTTADAVEAIYYAVDNGAQIISNSWGGAGYSQALNDAVQYAYENGVIVIAAAGNDSSSSYRYPAAYTNVMAVAATDSRDQRAVFSSFGDWVDIAAPGVDILSLRAAGTSMGTVFNQYLTVASGTSMACPHVSGAAALLLSVLPEMTPDEIKDFLIQSGDPIAPGTCWSNRRLVLLTNSRGHVRFGDSRFSCAGELDVWLTDRDLLDEDTHEVTVTSAAGDIELVTVYQREPRMGMFQGTLPTAGGDPDPFDGFLQLTDGQMLTAMYEDANYGGGFVQVAATAFADCNYPILTDVSMDIPGARPTVSFEADQLCTAAIEIMTSPGGPVLFSRFSPTPAMSHTIQLLGVEPETEYFFRILATDMVGNRTIEDNNGQYYQFVTTMGPKIFRVPQEYPDIATALALAWDGSEIVLADGVYSGPGFRNIDFKNRGVTVRSENGPGNCIINLQASSGNPRRAFKFVRGEGPDSVVRGLTIINGYGPSEVVYGSTTRPTGSAILCRGSSPTIENCIIRDNQGGWGAVSALEGSAPTLVDCLLTGMVGGSVDRGGAIYASGRSVVTLRDSVVRDNETGYGGGAFLEEQSDLHVTGGAWEYNRAVYDGGAVRSIGGEVYMGNVIVAGNTARRGGGINSRQGRVDMVNCTVVQNRATNSNGGGGIMAEGSVIEVFGCIFWDNGSGGGSTASLQVYDTSVSSFLANYCSIQGGIYSISAQYNCPRKFADGVFDADPCFARPGELAGEEWISGDYRLKSQMGRWDPVVEDWVTDPNSSPCIDAGDPNDMRIMQIWPHGQRWSLGAYGRTYEASLSNSWAGNPADLNYDGKVDTLDFLIWAQNWQVEEAPLPQDFNRDGLVDLRDFVIFQEYASVFEP